MNNQDNQRTKLFKEQDGKCFYCQKQMILYNGHSSKLALDKRKDICTLEHLFPRNDPRRYNFSTGFKGKRVVAACHACNSDRGNQPLEKYLASIGRPVEPYEFVPISEKPKQVVHMAYPHITFNDDGTIKRNKPLERALVADLSKELNKIVRTNTKSRVVTSKTNKYVPLVLMPDGQMIRQDKILEWEHQPISDITTVEAPAVEPYQVQPLNFVCGKCLDIFNSLPADVKWTDVSRNTAEPHCGC
jgi:hypothetical protein